jgi:integrase
MTAGHVRQRSPGTYEIRWPAGGKVCTRTIKGGKRDAEKALRAALTAVDTGKHVAPSKLTVGAFVADRIGVWDVTERTRENYRNLAKTLAPLADLSLQRLRTLDVEHWHANLRARGLASSTIRAGHRLLARVLADGVQHRLLPGNVAREQPPPKAPTRRVKVPNEDAIAPMLDRLRDDAFHAPVVLTLYAGLRRGELLALRWADVSLDDRTLRVERALEETAAQGIVVKSTKTESGERTITLSAAAIAALRDHRRAQLEMRLLLGIGKPSDDALIFPRLDGAPWSPNAFSVAWIRTVRRLGLPAVTWHALRHLHCSLLIRHGVDVVTISRRIGHSTPATTLRVYAHAIAKNDEHAAAALDRALGQ